MPDGERRLAAIMYTDMVGYTALGQRNESLSLALVEEQRKLVRPVLVRHNGREIKTMGDAFLVEFPDALDAVRCAYDIQRATREHNISLQEDKRIHLRVGLHLGDVVESQGDILGDAVNVASRIEPLAEDGGVCLTREVFETTHNKLEVPLVSIGMQYLKNVSEPVEVYRMEMPWGRASALKNAGGPPKRIAVLPFASMSPDPNDEYFADGLTEELINRISLVGGLEVIARTSVMGFKKKDEKISEIGRQLKVGTILEGSVRKAGDRIRVSAQLINANTEGRLWGESYDRSLEDIFEVQRSVAENVAGALELRILKEDEKRVEPPADMDAYTMYLRAMHLLHEGTETGCRQAITLLKDVISTDPTSVRAYAGLAQAWKMAIMYTNIDPAICVSRAEPAARKALELGPESAEAHLAMAEIHEALDRFDEERSELEKAVRINPNLAHAHRHLAVLYCNFGRLDEAIEYLQKACSLDPRDPDAANMLINALRAKGKVDDALVLFERVEETHRGLPTIDESAALCFLQKQDFAKAFDVIDTGLRTDPDNIGLKTARGIAYALQGRRGEAIAELRALMMDRSESNRLDAQLFIRAALGDFDEAFEALMRQAELHSATPLIMVEPILEPLRKDPRFSEFCKKVGLPA